MTFIPSFTFTNAPTALVAMNARPVVRARNGCTVRIYVTVSMPLEVVSARKRGTPPVFSCSQILPSACYAGSLPSLHSSISGGSRILSY